MNGDCDQNGDLQEEEALIRSMFLPRTASIGSASDLPETTSISALHQEPDESPNGLKETERQLKSAEKAFLNGDTVRSQDVSLKELSERFSKTTVPENTVSSVNKYMEEFVEKAVVDSVNTASPKMIGHMTSSLPYYSRPLSRLITTMNQNIVKTETANTITFLEREALAQLHQQIYKKDGDFYKQYAQDPGSVLGVLTSGGTIANITALWVARNSGLKAHNDFPGVEQAGLFDALTHYGYKGCAIIGSELLHYSMAKAADVLGFGVRALRTVPYDHDFRVKLDEYRRVVQECVDQNLFVVAVLGVAGATETGSIDDLQGIADIAKEYSIHFHVDAAWGGPCIFSKRYSKLLEGIEHASTITLDGHKQLYLPMGCGLCFFQDPELSLSIRKTAKYIIRKESYDLGKFTLEGSRPANAVFLHSNLNIFGVRGYELLVDRSIRMVRYMAKRIEKDSKGWFQLVVNPPMTNILLYRCIPPHLQSIDRLYTEHENAEIDELNVKLQKLQTTQGRTFVSRTTVNSPYFGFPIVALRVVIANPITFEADIDRVLQNQTDILASELSIGDKVELPRFAHIEEVKEETARTTPPSPSSKHENASVYWGSYWNTMPQAVKNLFKGDKELFLSSLVAPELGIEEGLWKSRLES